jgi:PAS domain S-box-containing protein
MQDSPKSCKSGIFISNPMRDSPGHQTREAKVEPTPAASNGVETSRRPEPLRAIIERLPDGIVVVDRAGTIRFVNPAAERLFGRAASDLLGTSFGFALVAGETTEIDLVQRRGADIVFAELRVVETEWEGEQVSLVSLRDITDRKQAEERSRQLVHEREARLEAEAASQAKSAFLAIMSHELRTPLNALLGYSELLELGLTGPLTDPQREQIGRIRMSAKHLLGLVNELLDLAKVEAGRLTVACTDASAGDAIASAIALIQPQAAARGLELLADIPDSAPMYVGDDERVRQIMINLLSNAVKFTPPGGRITIASRTTASPDGEARLQAGRTYVCLSVTDTGPGVPEEKQLSIFDPFVQAETGHTRTTEGSGLGLTISRRLARLMGGDLTLRSTEGKGSTFCLWLPAAGKTSEIEQGSEAPATKEEIQQEVEGLSDVGEALTMELGPTVGRIVDRLRGDPSMTIASGLKNSQLADHIATFLADVAGALVIIEEFEGKPSPLLADATEIQRLVSERHGAQRARLGWTESALRREFMIIREELEAVVRRTFQRGRRLQVEDAVAVLERFLDQSEYVAVRALEATRIA